MKTASQNRQRGPRKCPKVLGGALPHSERAALDAGTLWPRPSPRAERPEGQCRPTDHDLPTDPRAAGDGVSSRVSSTAARLARMAATALSIAASSGGRAARCCRSASNQSGHAAGRKTAIASAPLRATPVRFSPHTHENAGWWLIAFRPDDRAPPLDRPVIRPYPESTEGRPWGQPLKKPEGAPLNLG